MDNNYLRQLLTEYFNNTINGENCEKLLRYLDETDSSSITAIIDELLKTGQPTVQVEFKQKEQVYDWLIQNIKLRQGQDETAVSIEEPSSTKKINHWIALVAMLLLASSISFLIYRYAGKPSIEQGLVVEGELIDDIVLPDGNRAVLTLADGRTIVLDDSSEGILAEEVGVEIRRAEDGSVLYDVLPTTLNESETRYNTFSTPKGHSYQLVLPDGSKVWLNTGSSLRFPITFMGNERVVSLSGEAYFEVAENPSSPFKVEAGECIIRVLGTHFNVSAYADEQQVTTTLLEGSVKISKGQKEVDLKPGKQAVVDGRSGEIRQNTANINVVMAWKNGYFRFENESIERILTKISRWYDIEEVVYEGTFTDFKFGGTFHRSKRVTMLFGHLEKLAPIKFEIQGRRVVVMR